MILSFEDYCSYYEKNHRFIDGQYSPPNKNLNILQLSTKFNKYLKRLDKMANKEPSDYMQEVWAVEEECRKENPNGEYFWSRLTEEQTIIVRNEMRKIIDLSLYDPCHCISRGSNRRLATCKENIIIAPRAWHFYIDNLLDPYTEKHQSINGIRQHEIWVDILGIERSNYIYQLTKEGFTNYEVQS